MSEKKGSDYDESPKRQCDYDIVLNSKKCNEYCGYPERPSDYDVVLPSKKSAEYSGYQERSSDYEVVVPSKKRRKQITLMEKLDILKRYDYGERAVDISNALDLPSSTVRSIIRSSEKIKEFGRSATPLNAKCLFKNNRSSLMVEMEEMLSEWIDHQTQNQVPLNSKAIDNVAAAWNEVKPSMMNSAWRNLWPECVNDFRGFEEPVEQIAKDIVKMGKEMGLNELEDDDVQDLLASHSEEISIQDLNDVKYERSVCVEVEYEDDEVHENEETANMLTVDHLSTAVQLIENGLAILDENDPNRERSSSVKRTVNNAIDCYRELYKEKRKATAQLSLEMLFRNQSQGTDTQPQPGPSSRELLTEAPRVTNMWGTLPSNLDPVSIVGERSDFRRSNRHSSGDDVSEKELKLSDKETDSINHLSDCKL
ncbi:hypothetical protein J437_LFUL018312 [Ladona fulva]|uniref:HTH psq-type domain-containing protein n=1 Tax=Ladona fulva TaxID=123851 RepID=A0A8K0P848_LADFU|nr:hypothetical protein J437_LFUL018312 [Ladona fulva]